MMAVHWMSRKATIMESDINLEITVSIRKGKAMMPN
jgi:hypothetical protein